MRELKNDEIKTVAGGHRGNFDHAWGEGVAAAGQGGFLAGVVAFIEHYDFSS